MLNPNEVQALLEIYTNPYTPSAIYIIAAEMLKNLGFDVELPLTVIGDDNLKYTPNISYSATMQVVDSNGLTTVTTPNTSTPMYDSQVYETMPEAKGPDIIKLRGIMDEYAPGTPVPAQEVAYKFGNDARYIGRLIKDANIVKVTIGNTVYYRTRAKSDMSTTPLPTQNWVTKTVAPCPSEMATESIKAEARHLRTVGYSRYGKIGTAQYSERLRTLEEYLEDKGQQ